MKKVLSIMLVLAAFLAFSVLAYADGESFTMALTSAEVEPGDDLTVTATATNVSANGGLISLNYYLSIPAGVTYQSTAFNGTVDGWQVYANVVEGVLRVIAVNDSCKNAVETVSIDMVFATTDEGTYTFNLTDVDGSASDGTLVAGSTASCDASVKTAEPEPTPTTGIFYDSTADEYYYYENGARVAKGLVEIDGDIYYAGPKGLITRAVEGHSYQYCTSPEEINRYTEISGLTVETGKCVRQLVNENKMNGVLPFNASNKYYAFGEDGKMINESFGSWAKKLVWIVNGQPSEVTKGVIYNGAIYFITSGGAPANKGLYRVKATEQNGVIPTADYYMFNYEDGSLMHNRFALWSTAWGERYIVEGRPSGKTIIVDDGDTIALVLSGGKRGKGLQTIKANQLNGHEAQISAGTYMFDSQGHLFTGFEVYSETYGVRYFKNGSLGNNLGIIEDNGYLYFIKGSGNYAKKETVNVTAAKANGLIAPGSYYFGADGILVAN